MDEFVSGAYEHETIHVSEEGRHFIHVDKCEDGMDETRLRKSRCNVSITNLIFKKEEPLIPCPTAISQTSDYHG
jgi:hypothetical protein